MSQITKNISYSVATEISPIDLVLTPELAQVISGQPIVFTTQGSSSYDGSSITVSWGLESPVGSSVTSVEASTDTTEATLYPDVNGMYKVTAVATNDSGAVVSKDAYIIVSSSQIELNREKPDASVVTQSISSFYKVIQNKEAIESLWSEYVKVLSGEYRKAAEVVLSKSIDTIQPGRLVSNYMMDTTIDLKQYSGSMRVSDPFFGTNSGTTSIKNFLFTALVLNSTTISMVSGNNASVLGVSESTKLHIYSSNINLGGTYTIKSSKDRVIYLSNTTPVIGSTSTGTIFINTTEGTNEVSTTTPLVAGDWIVVKTQPILVLESSVNNIAVVDHIFGVSDRFSAEVHSPTVISLEPEEFGLSGRVYVPASELGGHEFFSKKQKTRNLSFTSPSVLLAPEDMGATDVGSSVSLLSSRYSGINARITSYYYDNTKGTAVFSISPPIPASRDAFSPKLDVRCRVSSDTSLSNVLLTIGRKSSPILNVSYFKDYTGASYANILTGDLVFPNNSVNLSWRVGTTLAFTSLTDTPDFVKEGVRPGDTLDLQISTSITNARTSLNCTVTGAYYNMISIEPTVDPLLNNSGTLLGPSVTDSVVASMLKEMNIPKVEQVSSTEFLFSSLAKEVYDSITSTIANIKYTTVEFSTFSDVGSVLSNTVYVTTSSTNNAIARVSVLPVSLRRNTTFPIKSSEPVAAIPTLTEFVYEKPTADLDESDLVAILHPDGTVTYREDREIQLLENVSYIVKNNTQFTSTTLSKGKGMVVEDLSGDFIDRGVDPGDLIKIDGVTYIIKTVLSSNKLELLKESKSPKIEDLEFVNKYYEVKNKNSYNYPYIQFRPEVFTAKKPVPSKLFAGTVVIDNIRQVEANFGVLVGYEIKDFLDYSSPQMSYLNAIRGLMYAISNGPTVSNVELATAILLNLPVSQRPSIILDIDNTNGRFVLQPVDPVNRQPVGTPEYYTFSTKETIEPFLGVSYNKATGESYKIGDFVEKFTPLTSKVVIEDSTRKPFSTLTQFHTWVIYVDANSISTRDLPLLNHFYGYARPIQTKPVISVVLFLTSTVTVTTSVLFDGTMFFRDDPGFGLEMTHAFDSRSAGPQILRLADVGDLSSRTLLLGKDLRVSSDGTTVTSSRGGFLLNSPDDFTDDPGLGVDNDVKEIDANYPFSGIHFIRGKYLVRAGDILRIYTGPNAGVYTVDTVVSDETLEISPRQGFGYYTQNLVGESKDREFGVYRLVSDAITTVTCSSVDGSESRYGDVALNWDGVAVGDVLVDTSNHLLKLTILDIPYDPITEDAASALITDNPPTVGSEYLIYRPLLIPKNYAQGTVTVSQSNTDPRHLQHDITAQYKIEVGDQIAVTSGTAQERYSVITKVGSGSIDISDDLGLTVGDTFELRKLGRPLDSESDTRLEMLHGYDDLSVTLVSSSGIIQAAAPTTTSIGGYDIIELSGFSSLPNPCDRIYLYDQSNTQVLDCNVYYQTQTSVVCFVNSNQISDYTHSHKVSIVRRSKS